MNWISNKDRKGRRENDTYQKLPDELEMIRRQNPLPGEKIKNQNHLPSEIIYKNSKQDNKNHEKIKNQLLGKTLKIKMEVPNKRHSITVGNNIKFYKNKIVKTNELDWYKVETSNEKEIKEIETIYTKIKSIKRIETLIKYTDRKNIELKENNDWKINIEGKDYKINSKKNRIHIKDGNSMKSIIINIVIQRK